MKEINDRLLKSYKFNAYEDGNDESRYHICLGPITDALKLAECRNVQVADIIVAALRQRYGQPECSVPLASRTIDLPSVWPFGGGVDE
jgi:hypothetical protein